MVYGPTYGYVYPGVIAPPGPMPRSARYYPPGVRKVYWIPRIAFGKVPSRAELNTAIDLSPEIVGMAGWSIEAAAVPTPDIISRFTSSTPGAQSQATSSLLFYLSGRHNDVRTLLVPWVTGFIVVLWEGDVAGGFMDVFPVWVSGLSVDTAIADAAQFQVDFLPTSIPALGVPIP